MLVLTSDLSTFRLNW